MTNSKAEPLPSIWREVNCLSSFAQETPIFFLAGGTEGALVRFDFRLYPWWKSETKCFVVFPPNLQYSALASSCCDRTCVTHDTVFPRDLLTRFHANENNR